MEWISIAEKLPEFNEAVLIYTEHGRCAVAKLSGIYTITNADGILQTIEFEMDDGSKTSSVTHWCRIIPPEGP